jgi:predicted dehydrogenase
MKHSASKPGISRRQFLAATSVALAAPTFIPASALGRQGQPSPSNRITMGVVGWGMQGPSNTGEFLKQPDCKVVAACDLDKTHLQAAVDTINGHYKNQDCKAYHDFHELMARTDIDAVMLAVPDTWHALVAIEAARNKKDIYGEKPLARTIAEQQAIVKAVQDNKRIWQTGSWQRSEAKYRKAAEIVRNGLIGKVTHVEVGLPFGHHDFAGTAPELIEKLSALPEKPRDLSKITPHNPAWMLAISAPPPELDYKTWLGPSQEEPYIKARVHMNWRWNYNVGGGQLLDWIGHHCDIAHWGLDCEQSGGPTEIEGTGQFPPKDAIWNTCTKYKITCKYPNDVIMTIADDHSGVKMGAKWIGTEGWVYVDRSGFDASDVDWFREIPADRYKVKLYDSKNHWANFIECVKSRKPTIAPVETAHHSAIPGHLGLIAMLVGRKIKWDAEKQVIVDDEGASKLLSRPYRTPWQLT